MTKITTSCNFLLSFSNNLVFYCQLWYGMTSQIHLVALYGSLLYLGVAGKHPIISCTAVKGSLKKPNIGETHLQPTMSPSKYFLKS